MELPGVSHGVPLRDPGPVHASHRARGLGSAAGRARRAVRPGAGPSVYQSMLSSAPYADSWRFFQGLDRAGVKIVLGVWGGPGAVHRGWHAPRRPVAGALRRLRRLRLDRRRLPGPAAARQPLGHDHRQRARRRRRQPDSTGRAGVYRASAGAPPRGRQRQAVRSGHCRRIERAAVPASASGRSADRRQPGVRRIPPVLPELRGGAVVDYVHARDPILTGDRHRVHVVWLWRPRRGPGSQRADRLWAGHRQHAVEPLPRGRGRGRLLGRRRLSAARPRRDHQWGVLRGPADDFTERPRYFAHAADPAVPAAGCARARQRPRGGAALSCLAVQTAQVRRPSSWSTRSSSRSTCGSR